MIELIVTIKNKAGLHTRPAATIVKLAAKYECEFFISRDGMNIRWNHRKRRPGFWRRHRDRTAAHSLHLQI